PRRRCSTDMTWLSKPRRSGLRNRCLFLYGASVAMVWPAAATSLPSARLVLDRYIAVTGGAPAWNSKKTERDEIEGRSLDGKHVLLHATLAMTRQGNSLNEIRVPEEAREGVYNGIAWAWTRLSGPRIK